MEQVPDRVTLGAFAGAVVLAVLHGQERFTVRGVIGGTLAVSGLAVISVGSLGGALSAGHLAAALCGVVAVAESSVLVKGYPRAHPITTNAVGMVAGAALLLAASLAFGERWAASATVYALTLMPVVAIMLGALVKDEPVTFAVLAGGTLVMAAVYVGALSASATKASVGMSRS